MSSTFVILTLLAAAVVVWIYLLGAKQKTVKSRKSASAQFSSNSGKTSSDATFHWPPIGEFDFEVVGESNYQRVISKLAGQHSVNGANFLCVASLVLEDSNRYDAKAVAVKIEGELVGYLSRDDARKKWPHKFRQRVKVETLS